MLAMLAYINNSGAERQHRVAAFFNWLIKGFLYSDNWLNYLRMHTKFLLAPMKSMIISLLAQTFGRVASCCKKIYKISESSSPEWGKTTVNIDWIRIKHGQMLVHFLAEVPNGLQLLSPCRHIFTIIVKLNHRAWHHISSPNTCTS